MSIRTATMSSAYSPATRRPPFFRRLVVTWLYVAAITGLMALFQAYQKNLSALWMTVFAILGIGLACGSISRALFFKASGFVRVLAVLLDVPASLYLLGWLSNWQMGIGPLNPWTKGIIPTAQLIQLGGAFLVAFICIEAWWKPRSKIRDVAEVQYSPRSREQSQSQVSVQSIQPRQQVQPRESFSFPSKKGLNLKFMKAAKSRRQSAPLHESFLTRTAQPVRSKRKLFSRKPNLQISLYEEHRCPFCLDLVKQNDPRGVKRCEVCNTLHHADCWAITGMCQVPHLNT